ncbi:decarboxylase,orotidine phosphate [Neurospora crassa]|nr:decarboxylase,orotidine phosphate [Neurospora crassa]
MSTSQETQPHWSLKQSFAERVESSTHPLTSYLFRLMEVKQSNLCLSADVEHARDLLALADKVGPSIVVLKTHYDLITGWDYHPHTGTGAKLAALARKHGFLIFEDRKFVDIGSTVQKQYTAGTARIVEWAHITNADIHAGEAMVSAMAQAAQKWRERIPYEVKTSVSVGTPVADQFADEEAEDQVEELRKVVTRETSTTTKDTDGRKSSIVSITTVTQTYEPADSPRLVKTISEDDEMVFPGIEEAPLDRGLLILAQMSSKGCLMDGKYTWECVKAARKNKGFVMGYVAQQNLNGIAKEALAPSYEDGESTTEEEAQADNFIHMTPGCKLPPPGEEAPQGDGLGQQYNTPDNLVNIKGTDIAIVGRGIITAADPPAEAERYRRKAWKAYQDRRERLA